MLVKQKRVTLKTPVYMRVYKKPKMLKYKYYIFMEYSLHKHRSIRRQFKNRSKFSKRNEHIHYIGYDHV